MNIDHDKTAFNRTAKAAMEDYLRSRSWVEKIESIQRINESDKIAKRSMRVALGHEQDSGDTIRR